MDDDVEIAFKMHTKLTSFTPPDRLKITGGANVSITIQDDVDYQYYFVYEKGTFNEQDDILFNLSWRENSRYILQNGEFFKVEEISNPYIYRPENNTIGYDKTIVLPYVTDDDVIYDDYNEVFYIQFFDLDNEVLSEWKKDAYHPPQIQRI